MKDRAQENILNYLMSHISTSDWKKIYKNKKINPVLGRTNTSNINNTKDVLRYLRDKFKIFMSGYNAYSLKSRNAEQEIARYIKEKR